MPRSREPIRDRIYRRLLIDPSGCLIWTGARNHGYGVIKVPTGKNGGKNAYVHRLTWELTYGPIPEGLVIDHLCGNKTCANPDHLDAVTDYENIKRGNGVCAPYMRGHNLCAKGHELTGENVITIRRCRTCHKAEQRSKGRRRRAKTLPLQRKIEGS